MDILEDAKNKMNHVLEHLKIELKSIRSGRANPGMLEGVVVDVYGTRMKIKELANLSAPEPRQLMVTPFDRTNLPAIRKGIELANLGFQPIVDGHIIRISVPPMDEAQRLDMVKICHKKREETKIGIRNVRRDCNDVAKKMKADGLLDEDGLKREEKRIQDLTDKFCKQADEMSATKEKEVMTI